MGRDGRETLEVSKQNGHVFKFTWSNRLLVDELMGDVRWQDAEQEFFSLMLFCFDRLFGFFSQS